ncbi:MAG TPA: hypothetical protein VLL82_10145 [Mycobacterium sp.]|nr:hypothetical protein [Mycobacterium sp.]
MTSLVVFHLNVTQRGIGVLRPDAVLAAGQLQRLAKANRAQSVPAALLR